MLLYIRKEEQIKKDEQYARVLQEQMDQNNSTTAPETRGSDLSPQIRVGGDQPGNEQVRRGQVRVEATSNAGPYFPLPILFNIISYHSSVVNLVISFALSRTPRIAA